MKREIVSAGRWSIYSNETADWRTAQLGTDVSGQFPSRAQRQCLHGDRRRVGGKAHVGLYHVSAAA